MSTFDGDLKVITLAAPTAGVLAVDVETDLYSEWKVWATTSDNSKYLPAFRNAGGDPLSPGLDAGAYFFLRNDLGWRIISTSEDQTVNYNGNIVGESAVLPIINATPTKTVLHLGLQPVTQNIDLIINDVSFIRQVVAGRAVVSADDLTVTIYGTDGITVLQVFTISADGRVRTPQ
tara:strand:+ start:8109 stop:8636 length:528 start_codon:yes stop_codon:yes gene_type:complete